MPGIEQVHCDVFDLASVQRCVVIHLAFKHEEQNAVNLAGAADVRAIEALGAALKGSDNPLVGTNATGALALASFQGQLSEYDVMPGRSRIDAEKTITALAEQDVRSSIVRLPPTVYSGSNDGFASGLIAVARATGVSRHLDDGTNRWPSADARDVARVYRLALESTPAGSRLHAVAEEGIALRNIAPVIGRHLSIPVALVAAVKAEQHFGALSMFVRLDNPTSPRITREMLGWTPPRPGLISDLEDERNFPAEVNPPSTG